MQQGGVATDKEEFLTVRLIVQRNAMPQKEGAPRYLKGASKGWENLTSWLKRVLTVEGVKLSDHQVS